MLPRLLLATAILACGVSGTAAPSAPDGRPVLRIVSFRVRELACHGCSLEIFKALVHAPGFVRVVETNVRPQIITVSYDRSKTRPTLLARRITLKTGWAAKQVTESHPRK